MSNTEKIIKELQNIKESREGFIEIIDKVFGLRS